MPDTEHTRRRFVAFFDIMGFKKRVYKDHDDLVDRMGYLQQIIGAIEGVATKEIEKRNKSITEQVGKNLDEIVIRSYARAVIFSDSILVYTEDDSLSSMYHIFSISGAIAGRAYESDLPLKGAISLGKFTANFEKSLYIGKPLIEAYLLQEDLLYFGVILHNKVENYLVMNDLQDRLKNEKWGILRKYDNPFKNGVANHQTVIWPTIYGKLIDTPITPDKLIQQRKSVSGSIRVYYDNTIMFFNEMT